MQAFDRGKIGCVRDILYFLCEKHIKNSIKLRHFVSIKSNLPSIKTI